MHCWSVVVCRAVVVLLVGALCCSEVRAELPPEAYRNMQAKSPEYLTIAVQSVETQRSEDANSVHIKVEARAKVRTVQRSKGGVKEGEVITIRYTHSGHKEPIAGPSAVPILKKGAVCPAYLEKKGEWFGPAAGGYTFHTMAPEPKQ